MEFRNLWLGAVKFWRSGAGKAADEGKGRATNGNVRRRIVWGVRTKMSVMDAPDGNSILRC